MARRKQSKGKCLLCGAEYAAAGMTKHIPACVEKNIPQTDKMGRFYLLTIKDAYLAQFWLHVGVSSKAKLQDLDTFLRDIWLECCGHLSLFDIHGVQYMDRVMERGDKSMSQTVDRLFRSGLSFSHEYDFGSTTELTLKVVSEFQAPIKGDLVRLFARNDLPEIPCGECGKPALFLCQECMYDDSGMLCFTCAKDHECDHDMLSPYTNSPRCGVCGYDGETTEEQDRMMDELLEDA